MIVWPVLAVPVEVDEIGRATVRNRGAPRRRCHTVPTTRQGYEMQLGMIGLGRMGANMVRRLMQAGHECVVFDVSADAVKARGRRGRHRRVVARGLRGQARRRRARCGSWCRPPSSTASSTRSPSCSSRATSSSTAATPTTTTTSAGPPTLQGGGHPLRRRRHQRRRLRPRARLLPDDRRRGRRGRPPRPDLRHARARRRARASARRAARATRRRPSRATCTAGRTAPATS